MLAQGRIAKEEPDAPKTAPTATPAPGGSYRGLIPSAEAGGKE